MNRCANWKLIALILILVAGEQCASAEEGSVGITNQTTPVENDCRVAITWQPTSIYVHENGSFRRIRQLPSCCVCELVPEGAVHVQVGDQFLPVFDPSSVAQSPPHFILRADAMNIEEMRSRVLAASINGEVPEESDEKLTVPRVVAVSDNRIVKAWKAVAPLVQRNARLIPEKRSPEPHFALGNLWMAVGSHTDALDQFQRGAEHIRAQKKGDLLEYAKFFTVLEESLRRVSKQPGRPMVAQSFQYWGYGIADFRDSRLDRAVFNFTDATRLDPSDPVNWYARALTYRALGLTEEAERDARIGVSVERRIERDLGGRIGGRLEMFQGSNRNWLEGFRNGDGVSWQRY